MGCKNCNKKTPCHSIDCGCKIKGLTANCVTYNGNELECSGIETPDTLDVVIKKLDTFICDIQDYSGSSNLTNIGGGAMFYAGVSNTGFSEIRTLESEDSSVQITQKQDTIDLSVSANAGLTSIGDGNPIYVGDNIGGDSEITTIKNLGTQGSTPVYTGYSNGNHKIAALLPSDTIEITTDNEGNIKLETPPSFAGDGIPRFIVNNNYTGPQELGTVNKPFKTIQNGLDAFVGTGTAQNPEFEGGIIIIQNANTYNFSGNFSYSNLNLVLESGAKIKNTPGQNNWFMDFGLLPNNKNIKNTISMAEDASITLQGKGISNNGVLNTDPGYKVLDVSGGAIYGRSSNSNDAIIDCDFTNQPNLVDGRTGGLINFSETTLWAFESKVWKIGGNHAFFFQNCLIRTGDSNLNMSSMEAFEQKGGDIDIQKSVIIFSSSSRRTYGFTFEENSDLVGSMRMQRTVIQPQPTVVNMFYVKGSNPTFKFEAGYNNTRYGNIDDIFISEVKQWKTVKFYYNHFDTGTINNTQVDLTANNTISVNNIVGGYNIDSLVKYADKPAAIAANLPVGAKFRNLSTSTIDFV